MYYFGCWDERKGHFLFRPSGSIVANADCPITPYELDGKLCITDPTEPEGVALLHRIKGWTVIAFWDRSGDPRHKSNSAFLAKGEYGFEEMCQMAGKEFPAQWLRIGFRVSLARV